MAQMNRSPFGSFSSEKEPLSYALPAPKADSHPTLGQDSRMNVEQAIALAYRRWNERQAPEAERLCRQVLHAIPGQPAALHLLGLIAHARGDQSAALSHLGEACKAANAPALYFSNLAEILRQNNQLGPAELAARQAIARDATLRHAWNNLGIILQQADKLEESLNALEHALRLSPENAELLNNLGNTLARLGRLDEAWGRYTQALQLNANNAEAHNNMASVLNLLGRPNEALPHAQTAIVLNPQLTDAYVNAAGILHAKGAHGPAMAQLDSLLEFSATHAKGLLLYAQCLEATQRHEEAIAVCKKAAAAHPKSGEAQLALGKLLQARGKTEAAAAYLLAARDLASNPAEALAVQAGFEMESGQFATAAETIRAALRENPKQANAWLTLSELKKFNRNDEDIPAMQVLLGAQGLQGYQEQIHLNFALGKAYLDFGETARGFSYLDTGNRMKRAGIDFDLEQTKKWMRAIAAQFSAARMASLAHSGLPDESALFIIGMPRSGTSLVEQILASHEQIFGAGELTSVQRQVDQLARITRLPYPEFAASLNPERLRRFAAAHLENLRRRSTHRYVVDKMPSNFFYAGLIHLALPNARIIHVRRNAADTCFSCYTKLFGGPQQFAYDQAELGGFYRAYENLMAHWREVLPQSRFIEVTYEDLVADIEGESRRLLNFCGLQWHEACARFFETERSVRTASATQVRQPPYRSSIGRAEQYRKHLTPLFAALEG